MSKIPAALKEVFENTELLARFERVAQRNGYSAEAVLSTFIKDYIVSCGHPEQVSGSIFTGNRKAEIFQQDPEEAWK